MTVTVKKRVAARIREYPGAIMIQVAAASDVALATVALRAAGQEISRLDGGPASAFGLGAGDRNNPKWVSDVVVHPDGPMLMVDGGFTPARLLDTIPGIIARRLEEAGVSATLQTPEDRGPLSDPSQVPNAVLLRVYAPLPRSRTRVEVPEGWLAEVRAWLVGTEAADAVDAEVMGSLGFGTFSIPATELQGLLQQWEIARMGWSSLAHGDPERILRAVGFDFRPDANINAVFAIGGAGVENEHVLAGFAELQDLARRLAGTVAYAFISVEPTLGALLGPWHSTEWGTWMDGPTSMLGDALVDQIVLDAFPYQVLGPGHLERLGALPTEAVRLSAGRFELSSGRVTDWMFTRQPVYADPPLRWSALRRDPTITQHVRDVLAPCLVTADQALDLVATATESQGESG
jgi:hypothetical protein